MRVGADSQAFSYLFDAWSTITEPTDALAEEKKALFRCYLYLPGALYAIPKIMEEFGRIPDPSRRAMHDSFLSPLFDTVSLEQPEAEIDHKAKELEAFHGEAADCRIVAEALAGELDVLLSYDARLLRRLSARCAPMLLLRPAEFWTSLNIARGPKPIKIPHPGRISKGGHVDANPLSQQSWWRW